MQSASPDRMERKETDGYFRYKFSNWGVYEGLRSLVPRDGTAPLGELQGAAEHLLDRSKAARGLRGSTTIVRLNYSSAAPLDRCLMLDEDNSICGALS